MMVADQVWIASSPKGRAPRNDSRRAVLVFGPEGSGTRLMTSILMYAGCTGSTGHEQWWDDHPFEEEDALVVWRRSFPHGRQREWPDVARMIGRLREAGYGEIEAVVMAREHHSLVRSQLTAGYVETTSEGKAKVAEAYGRIVTRLGRHRIPFLVVTYEGLVARPAAVQKWLAWELRLPRVPCVEVNDGNEKYYGE